MDTIRYSKDSEFLLMSYKEFLNWRIGMCISAIATGNFNMEVENSMIMMVDWQIVNNLSKKYKLKENK